MAAFTPGHTKVGGRQPGSTNKATQLSRQIFLPLVDEAAQTLLDVMRDTQAPHAARISAANAVLDRALGKPRQEVEHSGDAAQPLEILIRHFTDEVPPEPEDEQPRLL